MISLQPSVGSYFRSAVKNANLPSTPPFYTPATCGFVVKKADLVGETRFFPALPKTAVQQRQKMASKSRVNEQM
jgi:hypothetical protein